nr:autotransporter outer membrane beta-barrel domain-containing protein [Escherichia sp. MOD1-EC5949]
MLANLTTFSGGTTTLAAGSTLNTGVFTQQDCSVLNINLGEDASSPIITADSASLDGTLNITGVGNIQEPLSHDPYTFTLIDTDGTINGDFDDLTIAGMKTRALDFLTVAGRINPTDNSQYELATSLSWYADENSAVTDAHGTFTLSDPDGSFTLNTILADVAPNDATRWDGSTLTKAGDGTLILKAANTYSGNTLVNGGTLIAGVDNSLGEEGGLELESGSTFDLDGMSQNLEYVYGDVGSTLDLDGGKLTLGGDSYMTSWFNGIVTGGGLLDVYGDLIIGQTSDLSGLSATIDIEQYAVVEAQTLELGSGHIVADGLLLIESASGTLDNNISGSGDVWSTGDTTLSGDNSGFSGSWTLRNYASFRVADASALGTGNVVDGGTLYLGGTEDWALNSGNVISDYYNYDGEQLVEMNAGKVVKQGANAITIAHANTYSGETRVTEGTLWLTDTGVIGVPDASGQGAVNVDSGATFGGSGVVNGDVYNSGKIAMSHEGETGNTLTINGNYTGDNGNLYFNTQLGDDSSPTDKLVISGDTSGNTTVYVANVNGKGAQTKNGIEVIDVGGQSEGVFTQGNQVQIGLYEYRLYEDEGDWYLRSQSTVPPEPDDSGDVPVTPQYRPDIGAYLGNQWMVRNLQMQTLYDREGSQYHNEDGCVWMRFKAGNAGSQAADGNVDINNNYSQFQLGGDILAWDNDRQSLKVGVMASYINADTDSEGNRGADGSRFSATGNVDGYNLGVYATWFADAQNHQGVYVDSWYQYGFYNNSVSNGDVGSEGYDSTAHAISLETGYRHDIALSNQNTVSLIPQAQATWQKYDADSVIDNNGTRIDDQDSDSWTTRLGLRVDGKLHRNATSMIQPFAEVNWLYTSGDVSVSFDGAEMKQDSPTNRAQAKVGIQVNQDCQWSITGQVVGETGSHNYNDLNGSLNLRYSW